jgi:GT2 family glycosyltransferase
MVAKLTLMPLNYNGCHLLKKCLPSWLEAKAHCEALIQGSVDLWVIDNASSDDSEDWLREHHPEITWLGYDENLILGAYNDALARCESPYVMILNNDVLLKKQSLEPLLRRMELDPLAFGVMPRIEADLELEKVQGRLIGRFFHGHVGHQSRCDGPGGTLYLHGAAMVVNRQRFIDLGGFDPLFFYQEDNDLSFRAWREGWHCWFEPSAVVHHLGSQTTAEVHRGVVDRRAIKEKANNLFVLKNIQDVSCLLNFSFWTVLKTLKMILKLDRGRFWAYSETIKFLGEILNQRKAQKKLSDEKVMKLAEALRGEAF